MFTSDDAVRAATLSAVGLLALLQLPAGLVFVMDGVLIGAGDLRVLARQAVVSTAVFGVADPDRRRDRRRARRRCGRAAWCGCSAGWS